MQIKRDRKKLFKAALIFLIWLIAVFYIGSHVNKTVEKETKENPKITEGVDSTGVGLAEEQKTQQQKENTKKLNEINQRTTLNDLNKISDA